MRPQLTCTFIKVLSVTIFLGINFLSFSQVTKGVWTRKANMPTARWYPAAGVVNGKIYLIGGAPSATQSPLSVVEIYDPLTDSWITGTSMPTARTQVAGCVLNKKIYVIGGSIGPPNWTALSLVEVYDPASDTWDTVASLNTAREEPCVVTYNGKIYAFGGVNTNFVGLTNVEIYDTLTNTWSNGASMTYARGAATASVIGDKIYLMGGSPGGNQSWKPIALVHVYDPLMDSWDTTTNLITARSHLVSCALNDTIYAIGGSKVNSSISYSTVESYDTLSKSWSTENSMIFEREAFALAIFDKKIYVFGGTTASDPMLQAFKYVEVFDPQAIPPVNQLSSNPAIINDIHVSPNPFSTFISIDYSLETSSMVSLNIFDLTGKLIKNLQNRYQYAGQYSILWDGKDNSNYYVKGGNYLYKIFVSDRVYSGRIIFIP